MSTETAVMDAYHKAYNNDAYRILTGKVKDTNPAVLKAAREQTNYKMGVFHMDTELHIEDWEAWFGNRLTDAAFDRLGHPSYGGQADWIMTFLAVLNNYALLVGTENYLKRFGEPVAYLVRIGIDVDKTPSAYSIASHALNWIQQAEKVAANPNANFDQLVRALQWSARADAQWACLQHNGPGTSMFHRADIVNKRLTQQLYIYADPTRIRNMADNLEAEYIDSTDYATRAASALFGAIRNLAVIAGKLVTGYSSLDVHYVHERLSKTFNLIVEAQRLLLLKAYGEDKE